MCEKLKKDICKLEKKFKEIRDKAVNDNQVSNGAFDYLIEMDFHFHGTFNKYKD